MSVFKTRAYKDGVEICGVEGPEPTGDLVVPQTLPFKNDAGEVSQLPVLRIGEKAFGGCWALESITLPDGITEIGVEAFRNCRTLESITLPDGITEIGGMAFPETTEVIRRRK